MSDATPPTPPPEETRPNVNVSAGRDVNVGTFVGGNQVTTTNVGLGAAAVQRLVITVGVMVFVTAACFFSGGVALGFGAFAALNKSVNSDNPAAAARFETNIQNLRDLPAGQPFAFGFTEEEISSYFRLIVAPQIGVADGKVRLLGDTGTLVVGGRATDLNGLRFAAAFQWQDTPGAPLALKAAAMQILPTGNAPFGWVALPPSLLEPIANQINAIFGNVTLTSVKDQSLSPDAPAWAIEGTSR